MSGPQIPGLGALFASKESNNDQSISVTGGQAVTQEPQPTVIDHPGLQPTDSEGTVDEMVVDKHDDSKILDDEMIVDHPPSPPSLTSGLEALLGGLDPLPATTPILSDPSGNVVDAPSEMGNATLLESGHEGQVGDATESGNGGVEEEHPEWEADSSPYESSSDSSSSDDSDDDSDDEKDYKVLGPEETARILMEMDGGSDDEGDGKKGSGSLVRTKNELPETIIPRPDVQITPEMEILELGVIEHFVDNIAVIKANTTGEYEVLDTGSVLCLQDRTVIAALADVIAAVREPRYTAGFTDEEEIKSFGLEAGTKIFYPPALANLGMTQALKAMRGTDASNWHDEEVAEDEVEFSDDEKEAEHKRQLKAKKRGTRGARDGGADRGGRGDSVTGHASNASNGLKYDDDDDDDGPYRPLSRPLGFGQNQPAQGGNETASGGFSGHGGAYRGNRGDFRGRGNRGRAGRGNRGGNTRSGHSLPPRPQGQAGQGAQSYQQMPSQSYTLPPTSSMPTSSQPYPVFPPPQPNSQQPPQPPNQQFPFAWPQNPQSGFYPPPPPPPQFTGQPGANGMYFNPNLLAVLQAQVQSQIQQNQQNQQAQQTQPNQHQNSQWSGQQGQYNNQWAGQGGRS